MSSTPATWITTRAAGVLAHLSSLPGDYGIGNLGLGARGLVDFLAAANLRYWQICPIGPTGYGDSPYQLFSGRAGNPYFLDLGDLVRAGLLTKTEVACLHDLPSQRVDYGQLYGQFWDVLARAHERFAASAADEVDGLGSFGAFRRRQETWLLPFSDFMALKALHRGRPWALWPKQFQQWSPELRSAMPEEARRDADKHAFYQYLFFGQWDRLRRYAHERKVSLIGDVPIFVALDSADTWTDRRVFKLDEGGRPLAVAGVPPDYFSSLGQLWGNPLYDWDYLRSTGYCWWVDRLKAAFELYDVVRLDHFRGFDTYWEVPTGAQDARSGQWRKGPGLPFFEAVRSALPQARIIAEDLGYVGPDVVALRRAAGLPGMKVLQFAYGHDKHNVNLPHFFPAESVAYTGTHDNLTTRGWLESLPKAHSDKVRLYFQLDSSNSAWPIIRALLSSTSRLAIVPIQDLMDLPASATLNRPGTAHGNWQWRFTPEQLSVLADRRMETLRRWIALYDRDGSHSLCEYSEPPND